MAVADRGFSGCFQARRSALTVLYGPGTRSSVSTINTSINRPVWVRIFLLALPLGGEYSSCSLIDRDELWVNTAAVFDDCASVVLSIRISFRCDESTSTGRRCFAEKARLQFSQSQLSFGVGVS